MEVPKYANNGTYGCVFRPGVACTKGKVNDRNTVSKVFKKGNTSTEEVALHNKIVDKIDPEGLFTVKLLESCNINLDKFPQKEVDKSAIPIRRDFSSTSEGVRGPRYDGKEGVCAC